MNDFESLFPSALSPGQKRQLLRALEEIVGGDEDYRGNSPEVGRNEVRHEIRTKLKEFIGGEDG